MREGWGGIRRKGFGWVMRGVAPFAVVMLLLAGCAQIEQGIAAKQVYNDAKARTILKANCDIALGAYFRLPPSDRRALTALCGGVATPQ